MSTSIKCVICRYYCVVTFNTESSSADTAIHFQLYSYACKIHCVSEKLTLFLFCDYSVKCLPFLIIMAILQLRTFAITDIFLSCNIQFVYEYYRIKNEIFCMLSMLPLCLAVVQVSCSFFKSLFSPHSLYLYSKIP